MLLWTVLSVGAIGVMLLLGRSLWRKSLALFRELGEAADRLGVLDEELTRVGPPAASASDDLAIFADPVRLRQEWMLRQEWTAPRTERTGRSGWTGRTLRTGRQPRHRAVTVRPTEPGRADGRQSPDRGTA